MSYTRLCIPCQVIFVFIINQAKIKNVEGFFWKGGGKFNIVEISLMEIMCRRESIKDVINISLHNLADRLCGLAIRVPGYRSRDPGSIPGATRFSEK
jgi:hypothetical protein